MEWEAYIALFQLTNELIDLPKHQWVELVPNHKSPFHLETRRFADLKLMVLAISLWS